MNKHHSALEFDKVLERLRDFAGSEEGKEQILLLLPENDIFLVSSSLEKTADAFSLMALHGAPSFGGIRNINGSLARANAGGVLTMSELLRVAGVLRSIRGIVEWRDSSSGTKTTLDALFDHLSPNKYFEEKIYSAIISEDEMSDHASPQLNDIRRKMRSAASRVRDQLDKMIHSSFYQKYLQEPIVTQRNGRYVVPVKAQYRSEVKGLVHDTSSSGGTVFIEPASVVEANNAIKVLQTQERDEIERILEELSAEAGGFYETIKLSCECAVELDVIFAKAKYAYETKSTVPVLNDKGRINFKKARHPLLPKGSVVPTDINLGIDFDTLIITGPNTGGKTVSIKTLGLLTLMASSGMMIPAADGSEAAVFENVFSDIGDEQSIEQSLSTFSSHITNIIGIDAEANERSLVLIDELGAGTDPVEGAALAIAILENFHAKGAKVAATTHYAELKAYALSTPRVENGSCEFDVQSLKPTYKLLIGLPGRSNAFAISERLGMSSEIIRRAETLVSNEDQSFETTIGELEKSRQLFEERTKEAEELMAKARKETEKAREIREGVDALKERELEKARAEANRIVDRARRSADALLSELEKVKKENEAGSDKYKRAKSLIRKSGADFAEIVNPVIEGIGDEEYVLPRPLKIGDSVLIADLGERAEVASLPDRKGKVEVLAGSIKMKVDLEKLRLIEKAESKSRVRPPKSEKVFAPADGGKGEIDIRGMTVDDGIMAVDRQIDVCMRSGFNRLHIIHGKGTGALRKGIQDYLRRNRFVKSFRDGKLGEGDTGVTVATLR